jgi:hypothetical protein
MIAERDNENNKHTHTHRERESMCVSMNKSGTDDNGSLAEGGGNGERVHYRLRRHLLRSHDLQ